VQHRTTLLGYIFATKACIDNHKQNLLNSNISSTCPLNMVNFGTLAAEIDWRVWGTPANFNRFRVLASLLQRHRPTEVNETLHDVWLSPGMAHYIYIFCRLLPRRNFAICKIHCASYVLLYWQRLCTRASYPPESCVAIHLAGVSIFVKKYVYSGVKLISKLSRFIIIQIGDTVFN